MAEKLEFKAKLKMPSVSLIAPGEESNKKFKAQFVKSFQKAGFQTEKTIGYWLDEAMDSETWNWTGSTIRQDGSVATTPRNIVDTGRLKASRKLTTQFGVTQVTWKVHYTAPYAGIVHWGGYVRPYGRDGDTTYVPGRPWIKLIFKEDANEGDSDAYNFLAEVKDSMIAQLGGKS